MTFIDAGPEEAFDVIFDVGARLAKDGLRRGDAQIIAPVNAGPAGILAINRRFHELRMQASADAPRLVPGRTDIAEGDPVIWTRNDYERDLMNGSTGRIVEAHRDHANGRHRRPGALPERRPTATSSSSPTPSPCTRLKAHSGRL